MYLLLSFAIHFWFLFFYYYAGPRRQCDFVLQIASILSKVASLDVCLTGIYSYLRCNNNFDYRTLMQKNCRNQTITWTDLVFSVLERTLHTRAYVGFAVIQPRSHDTINSQMINRKQISIRTHPIVQPQGMARITAWSMTTLYVIENVKVLYVISTCNVEHPRTLSM